MNLKKMKFIKKYFFVFGIIFGIFIFSLLPILNVNNKNINILAMLTNKLKGEGNNNEIIKSITLESPDYNNKAPGSFKVEKSAKWTSTSTAQINFDVSSIVQANNNKDIVLVLDVSNSMLGPKLEKLKNDTKELTNYILSNSDNKMSIITYSESSSILTDFTSDKEKILRLLDELEPQSTTNYNSAFKKLDSLLKNYLHNDDKEVVALFLTDGEPNIDTPNQVGTYKLLKSKYPYITINGIQYEMGNTITKELIDVSDNQWSTNINDLYNALFEATVNPYNYEKFEITDYINTDYFYINSSNDIEASNGDVTIDSNNKIIWNISNDYMSGSKANLKINITLKEDFIRKTGYYTTNKKVIVTYKKDGETKIIESEETPNIKKDYKVIYEVNAPEECNLNNEEETHFVFESVSIKDPKTCDGYIFKGWNILTEVDEINDEMFIMPSEDVIIKGTWSKPSIIKTMSGEIKQYKRATLVSGAELNIKMKELSGSTSPTTATSNSNIKRFKYSTTIPDSYKKEEYIVSTTYSQLPIYMWYEDGTIYWWSEDESPFLNENSSYFFYNMTGIEDVDISKFDTSNVVNALGLFYNCNNITSLDVSGFDTSSMTNMEGMFANCYNLKGLDLSNFDTSNVTTMAAMFQNNNELETLNISSFDTSKVTNMRNMFLSCKKLRKLDLSNFNTSKVTNMRGMFYSCTRLEELNITSFDTSNVTDMYTMFGYCSELTTLDLSNFNTSKVNTMYGMFYSCGKLKTIYASDRFVKSGLTSTANYMFTSCYNLMGGNGTKYSSSYVTQTYARIDEGTTKGYFTRK